MVSTSTKFTVTFLELVKNIESPISIFIFGIINSPSSKDVIPYVFENLNPSSFVVVSIFVSINN